MAIKKAHVITVTSVKGGTGKSTTVLNLGGVLSLKKKKTLILDLDLYSGAIAPSLNVEINTDLYRLINDMSMNKFDNIENYVCTYNEYIDIIPAPKDPRLANKIKSKYLSLVIKKASTRYDYILIDTTHSLDDINLLALDNSDLILYLITNNLVDLKSMRSMISIYKGMEKDNYRIIMNNSIDRNHSCFTNYDIKNILGDEVDYIIPEGFYMKNIDKYVIEGKILSLVYPKKYMVFENIITDFIKDVK